MKTYNEFLSEAYQFATRELFSGHFDSFALSKGYKNHAGEAGFKNAAHHMSLYFLRSDDQAFVSQALTGKLRSGEWLFRYVSPGTKSAGIIPIVKINPKRGLVYFNKPEASDEDILDFEKKGEKLQYLTLTPDYEDYSKSWFNGR